MKVNECRKFCFKKKGKRGKTNLEKKGERQKTGRKASKFLASLN